MWVPGNLHVPRTLAILNEKSLCLCGLWSNVGTASVCAHLCPLQTLLINPGCLYCQALIQPQEHRSPPP